MVGVTGRLSYTVFPLGLGTGVVVVPGLLFPDPLPVPFPVPLPVLFPVPFPVLPPGVSVVRPVLPPGVSVAWPVLPPGEVG